MGRVLLSVLLAALVVATLAFAVALPASERAPGTQRFMVAFNEQQSATSLPPKSREGPGQIEFEAPVPVANLTRLRFDMDLSWDKPRPNAISLDISFVDPQGETQNVSMVSGGFPSASETTFHEFIYGAAPGLSNVEAVDLEEAKRLLAQHARTEGTGDWRILVTIPTSQYDTPAPPTYTLSVSVTAFSFEGMVSGAGAT